MTVEHEGGVQRINESKIRRDHDPWHDHPLPAVLEDGKMLNPAEGAPPGGSLAEKEEGPTPALGEYAADSFWPVKTKGQINFLELFGGGSETCAESGLSVGETIDILRGHDLTKKGVKTMSGVSSRHRNLTLFS